MEDDEGKRTPGLPLPAALAGRLRGISPRAISRQVQNGLIPTHGPLKRIDPAEADQWYWPKIDAG